jgi:Fe-S cluster biosynthesis and repair protein YggX
LIRTHQRAVGLLLVPRENTPDGQHQEIIVQQMEQFFFGEGAALPPNKRARVNLSSAKYMIRG